MQRDEVLAYEARRRIYRLIAREPALHLRELERRSGMPLGTLRHHLRFLEEHGIVQTHEDRNVVRYFAAELAEPEDRAALAGLRQEALRRVVLFLLARGGSAPYKEMLGELALPPSTLAVYLAQLTKRGILARGQEARGSRYEVRDPERIVRLLHTYRASFLDALVDHLLDVVEQDEP